MNKNIQGMLWTAWAVVVGIVIAAMVQKQMAKRKSMAAASDEG